MKNIDPKTKVRPVNEETEDPLNSIEQDEPRSDARISRAPHFDQQVRTSDGTTEVEGSKASHADTFETDSRPGSGI